MASSIHNVNMADVTGEDGTMKIEYLSSENMESGNYNDEEQFSESGKSNSRFTDSTYLISLCDVEVHMSRYFCS